MVWKVDVFFYGSYMNFDVLKEVDIVPASHQMAILSGFDLVIAPRANLIRDPKTVAYGVLIEASHAELGRLYSEHAQGLLGETYLPEAVIVTDAGGKLRPAMTYIAHSMAPRPPDRAYVERIARPAERYGFPRWYVEKIRAF